MLVDATIIFRQQFTQLYGIYTFITTTEKPRELVIAEDFRRLAQQGDLTSAAIRGPQMMAEAQVSYRPATLGQLRSSDGDVSLESS